MPDEPIWPAPSTSGSGPPFSSWIDLNSSPYSIAPGGDVQTALQAAVNFLSANDSNGTIYCSKQGHYTINGARTSSTVLGYTYDGQILFPARDDTRGKINIRIMGGDPAAIMWNGIATEPVTNSGTTLQSNAAGGYIFDAIPASNTLYVHTNVSVTFENIALRSPANPQNGVVKGQVLAGLRLAGSWSVDTTATGGGGTLPNGPLAALVFPAGNNAGVSMLDGVGQIVGYPIGFQHTEHFVLNNVLCQSCTIAAQPLVGASVSMLHSAQYRRLLIQGCPTGIKPSGTGYFAIDGYLDVGDSTGTFGLLNVVDDANGNLYGSLKVHAYKQQGGANLGSRGFPINGAANLSFLPNTNSRPPSWPSDNFTRINVLTSTGAGVTDDSYHPWIMDSAANFTTTQTGGISATTTANAQAHIRYFSGRAGKSRIVRTTFVLGATYECFQYIGRVISGANLNHDLAVEINAGLVSVIKQIPANTTLCTSAAGAVTANATHVIDTIITQPFGGTTYTIEVRVDGVSVLTTVTGGGGTITANVYSLSATEIGQLSDTDLTRTQDGFGFFSDATSSCTRFAVMET